MKSLVTLSRAFVEFGPFTKAEVLDFSKRGLLQDSDYLRDEGSDAWTPSAEWLTASKPAPKLKVVKAAAPKAAPAAKKTKKAA
ncbi:MAG: hypothetical protein ACK5TH_19185 [Prosthecobacter sp.]|jgi:hypothetical protein